MTMTKLVAESKDAMWVKRTKGYSLVIGHTLGHARADTRFGTSHTVSQSPYISRTYNASLLCTKMKVSPP